MAKLVIGTTELEVKDYSCVEAGDFFKELPGEEYLKKDAPKLWLYVNLTDECNAACPFCVNGARRSSHIDLVKYEDILKEVLPYINGVSFSGGEPMLYPNLLDAAISITSGTVSPETEIDLVSNGTALDRLVEFDSINKITSIHLSRHAVSDGDNTKLMGHKGPSCNEISDFLHKLKDPGKVVLNCVLQKDGVKCCQDVADYLDMAIRIGVQNTSFITMFMANKYCEDNYISPFLFPYVSDAGYLPWNNTHPNSQFAVWNRHTDKDYCSCLSGSYRNDKGHTRFYFRCPGTNGDKSYCRQLVYTAENHLQDGFGTGRRIIF